MMNTDFEVLNVNDTFRTVIECYQKYKITTLPVVDEKGDLIGVIPRKRLFKALLEGKGLDDPFTEYMVRNPIFVTVDRTYDEYSLVVQVTKSKADNVVVLDRESKVVGMIGTAEYLRESLNMIITSSALMESLFRVNYEGIIIVDSDGYILRVNPAAESMFRINSTTVQGKHLNEVLPEIEILDERRIGRKK